jgi:hypothetical protein
MTAQKPVYMPTELILNLKKGMCLPHVSLIFKKSVLKLLDRTVYYVFCTMHCNMIQYKPILSTIAEIFLQYFQDKHIKHFLNTKNVTFYVHHVDDILII